MVLDTGRPISAVAKEVGVNPMTLSRWVKIQSELDSRDSRAAARAQKIKERRLARQQRNEDLDKQFLAVMKKNLPDHATKSEKFDLMEQERGNFDLSRMARLLGVTKGGFYKHIEEPRRENRLKQQRLNDKLDLFVYQIWLDSNEVFGAARIAAVARARWRRRRQTLPSHAPRILRIQQERQDRHQAHHQCLWLLHGWPCRRLSP